MREFQNTASILMLLPLAGQEKLIKIFFFVHIDYLSTKAVQSMLRFN